MADPDRTTYSPFILRNGQHPSLFMSDRDMALRVAVFEEKAREGWSGGGYDWTSIARVLVAERFPDLQESVEFDPEAGMFSAHGPLDALKQLGAALRQVFEDEDLLRDLLSRAELD